MEERRQNGFHVRPSFGQVLGYIPEGEPLSLDLPNRKASIYTSYTGTSMITLMRRSPSATLPCPTPS